MRDHADPAAIGTSRTRIAPPPAAAAVPGGPGAVLMPPPPHGFAPGDAVRCAWVSSHAHGRCIWWRAAVEWRRVGPAGPLVAYSVRMSVGGREAGVRQGSGGNWIYLRSTITQKDAAERM